MKILDILLYPKSLYTKLTDKKTTLCLGIILIGIVDLSFSLGITQLPGYFTGKPQTAPFFSSMFPEFISRVPTALILNFVFSLILIILLGVMDVLFFSYPLFDIFKVLAGKFKFTHNGSFVKLAKVYIMTHFIIIPVNVIIILLIDYYKLGESKNYYLVYPIWIYLEIIMPIWFSAIITRGLNVLYNVEKRFSGLVFIVVYIWNYLLSAAFGIINGFLIGMLFK